MVQATQPPRMEGLIGLKLRQWLKLLWDNRFAISRRYVRRTLQLTIFAMRTSFYWRRERKLLGSRLNRVEVPPPTFVLGHWRSGTTLVHNVLCVDERYGYPNMFQVSQPHIFLSLDGKVKAAYADAAAQRRHMDNVEVTMASPGEDEVALAMLTLFSPLLGWTFPRRAPHYDRYLTFRDVPDDALGRWKEAFLMYMKKLTLYHRKPMILKSPPHTARIRLLLELFPEARFVHVHRDPYAVFQSTVSLYRTAGARSRIQVVDEETLIDGILRRYQVMYDAYFDERRLIPANRLCEVRFEDFESDIVGGARAIYRSLELDGFENMLPRLEAYAASLAGYQKNRYGDLDPAIRTRVSEMWRRNFQEWGYPS